MSTHHFTNTHRSEEVELEIQRYCLLALCNLASSPETHDAVVDEGALTLLISLSDSEVCV